MVISRKRCWALGPFGWDNAPLRFKRTVSSIVLIITNFSFEGVTPSSQQMNFSPSPSSPPHLAFLLIARTLWMLLPSLLINAEINMPENRWAGSSVGNLALQVSACRESKTWQYTSAPPTPYLCPLWWCGRLLWPGLGNKSRHFPPLLSETAQW